MISLGVYTPGKSGSYDAMLMFLRDAAILFFPCPAAPFYLLNSSVRGPTFSTFSSALITRAILASVKWNLTVACVRISLIAIDGRHLFMCCTEFLHLSPSWLLINAPEPLQVGLRTGENVSALHGVRKLLFQLGTCVYVLGLRDNKMYLYFLLFESLPDIPLYLE